LTREELVSPYKSGFSHDTVTINIPKYLKYLEAKVLELKGQIYRHFVAHVHDPFMDTSVDAVVNCTGYSAKFLGGVQDLLVYPIRGHTVLVQLAADVTLDKTIKAMNNGVARYVIPRGDGTVILGGTFEAFNNNPVPDPKLTQDILHDNLKLCPELKGCKVLAEPVGFRPGRIGGIRNEVLQKTINGRSVYECHNYGHGGYGYQTSWASADDLVKKLLLAKAKSHL